MTKLKTSISLDERLLADLDRQADAAGVSRSELIERLCRRGLDGDSKIEIIRFNGPPTAILPVLSSLSWQDEDGPVELVLRAPVAEWEQWRRKGSSRAAQ